MTTRVFGDKLGFKAGNMRRKPPAPPVPKRSPAKTVLWIVLALVSAFFILKNFGVF
jgi:hypothetical protein